MTWLLTGSLRVASLVWVASNATPLASLSMFVISTSSTKLWRRIHNKPQAHSDLEPKPTEQTSVRPQNKNLSDQRNVHRKSNQPEHLAPRKSIKLQSVGIFQPNLQIRPQDLSCASPNTFATCRSCPPEIRHNYAFQQPHQTKTRLLRYLYTNTARDRVTISPQWLGRRSRQVGL